jgi:hypothetical protein
MSNTFDSLVEAVQVSGKKFTEISKDSILAFLERQGEPKNTWESTYQRLGDMFNPKKKSNSSSGFGGSTLLKEDRTHRSAVVDYTDNSHNDVKVRQPRKSVFGEITKVAG